jgi:ABC-type ATPase with predicted acetyltransferase domain
VRFIQTKHFRCYECGEIIEVPYGQPKPLQCPKCGSSNIHRLEEEKGPKWIKK